MANAAAIGLVDYGAGNYGSVANALRHLGIAFEPVRTEADLARVPRVVLPGVGAFGACRRRLDAAGLTEPLKAVIADAERPFLGICVGMQLLATVGREFGDHEGLGAIPGEVRRIEAPGLRLPHVGWNVVTHAEDALFAGLGEHPTFYFVHSYQLVPDDAAHVIARCEYREPVSAAVRTGRAWGVQFHPEKSQQAGLRLLRNFASL
jgi:imidazole glycerol-phosphate synthase subunit HisH